MTKNNSKNYSVTVFHQRTEKSWLDYFDEAEWQHLFTVLNQGNGGIKLQKTPIQR